MDNGGERKRTHGLVGGSGLADANGAQSAKFVVGVVNPSTRGLWGWRATEQGPGCWSRGRDKTAETLRTLRPLRPLGVLLGSLVLS